MRKEQCLLPDSLSACVSGMNKAKAKDTSPTTAKETKATAKPRRLAKTPATAELRMAPTLKDAWRRQLMNFMVAHPRQHWFFPGIH